MSRRRVDPADLVGITEIARVAGVGPTAVSNWIVRYDDFPKPVVTLSMGSVWDRTVIEAWLRTKPRWSRLEPRLLKPKLPESA